MGPQAPSLTTLLVSIGQLAHWSPQAQGALVATVEAALAHTVGVGVRFHRHLNPLEKEELGATLSTIIGNVGFGSLTLSQILGLTTHPLVEKVEMAAAMFQE